VRLLCQGTTELTAWRPSPGPSRTGDRPEAAPGSTDTTGRRVVSPGVFSVASTVRLETLTSLGISTT
jgi:hypothetical protein